MTAICALDRVGLPLRSTCSPSRASPRATGSPPTCSSRTRGLLESTLEDFGIRGEIIHVRAGPVVTLYELEAGAGRQILARHRPGRRHRPLDVGALRPRRGRARPQCDRHRAAQRAPRDGVFPRDDRGARRSAIPSTSWRSPLGKTIGGEPVVAELAKMPHLLGGRHHRLRQVGRHQHDDPVAALSFEAGGLPADHGRSRRCWNCSASTTASHTC